MGINQVLRGFHEKDRPDDSQERSMTVLLGPCCHDFCILHVAGPLLMPTSRDLRRQVRSLLTRGQRGIVLDLGRVSRIDAAGIGELVRAYNMVATADGLLRVVNLTRRVREILRRVELLDLLSADEEAEAV